MHGHISIGIVGGGPSGLTALYECRKLNLPVTLYEKQESYGGVWNQTSFQPYAHKSTLFNSSTIPSSLDCEVPLAEYVDSSQISYTTSTQFWNYLSEFVKLNDLTKWINYHSDVVEINKTDEGFRLSVLDTDTKIKQDFMHQYVIISTGRFGKEVIPGQPLLPVDTELNNGYIWHSRYWDILNESSLSWKVLHRHQVTLLVVGGGHSSSEAIQDTLVRFQETSSDGDSLKIFWSPTRDPEKRNVWMLDRYPYSGRKKNLPVDQSGCRLFHKTPEFVFNRIMTNIAIPIIRQQPNSLFNVDNDRLCISKTKLYTEAIKSGIVEILSDPVEVIEPLTEQNGTNQMKFITRNKREEFVDSVILCTGYQYQEPFVGGEHLLENKEILYRNMIPLREEFESKLAFIGTTKILGSVFPVSQMECRWLLFYWFKTQSANRLQKLVNSYRLETSKLSKEDKETLTKIDIRQTGPAMEILAKDLGVRPSICLKLLHPIRANRHFGLACLIGPWVVQQYSNCLGETTRERVRRENYMIKVAQINFHNAGGLSFHCVCVLSDVIYYSVIGWTVYKLVCNRNGVIDWLRNLNCG